MWWIKCLVWFISNLREKKSRYTGMKKNINKLKVTKYRTAPILSYVSEKNPTRRKLADEFISISPSFCFRSVASLKKFYENRKHVEKLGTVKKNYLQLEVSHRRFWKNMLMIMVLSIVREKSPYGWSNPFDKMWCKSNIRRLVGIKAK